MQGLLAFAQHQSQHIQAISSKTILLFNESKFGQHVYIRGLEKLILGLFKAQSFRTFI